MVGVGGTVFTVALTVDDSTRLDTGQGVGDGLPAVGVALGRGSGVVVSSTRTTGAGRGVAMPVAAGVAVRDP